MSAVSVNIRFKINFPVIFMIVLALHVLFMAFQQRVNFAHQVSKTMKPREGAMKLQSFRTIGSPLSKRHDTTYLSKNNSKAKTISPEKVAPAPSASQSTVAVKEKPAISFKDLSVAKNLSQAKNQSKSQSQKVARPGTRPDAFPLRPKALKAISLRGEQIQQFAQSSSPSSTASSNAAAMSGDPRTKSLSNSDIMVNLEVPEGVDPDQLNEYELMFYGFQRRTAINYINSFYKHLDKFQAENPHLQFPMTGDKQVMTGRLTYDEKGNIKQIKMVRLTNVTRLQDFFVEVLKDMDTLHNPPQALLKKEGEFSIFFSLVING